MDDYRKYFDPQTLANLQGLHLKARLIVEGFVSGLHKSPFQGFSVEFAEHREYVPGDDLRYVDWKVFGKTDRYYLKQFEEETNFACYILLDTSESMTYQSAQAALSKLHYAQLVAASLALIVVRQQDAVGVATFDERVTNFVRPSSQPSQLEHLVQTIEHVQTRGRTTLGPMLHELAQRIVKRAVVVVLSDFFDDPQQIAAGLKYLRHRKHDVSLLQIIDPAEQEFPFESRTLFHGLEDYPDETIDPRTLRQAYQQEFHAFQKQLQRVSRELRMDYQCLRTDASLDVALSTFLERRSRAS